MIEFLELLSYVQLAIGALAGVWLWWLIDFRFPRPAAANRSGR